MRKASLTVGIVFLIFSLTVMIASWSMEYYSSIGPGPGFFPFWLSLILGLLSVVWLIQIVRSAPRSNKSEGQEKVFPRGEALFRFLSIIGALCFMVLLMEPLGFQISMFAFMIFLLMVLGRVRIITTIIIAIISSFGLFQIFTLLLDVQLPHAAIPLLASIGL